MPLDDELLRSRRRWLDHIAEQFERRFGGRVRIHRILWGLAAWEIAVAVPFAIKLIVEAITPNVMPYIPGGWVIPATAVLGVAVGSICALTGTLFRGGAASVVGFIEGAGCIVGLGWGMASHGGFEAAGLFSVSLLLCIPSGIGGAIAGWLNRRMPSPKLSQ